MIVIEYLFSSYYNNVLSLDLIQNICFTCWNLTRLLAIAKIDHIKNHLKIGEH